MYKCDRCCEFEQRLASEQWRITALVERVKELLGLKDASSTTYAGRTTRKPNFLCAVCDKFVDPKNVYLSSMTGFERANGAVSEVDLPSYGWVVKCHGETHREDISLVYHVVSEARAGDFGPCHHEVFRPAPDPVEEAIRSAQQELETSHLRRRAAAEARRRVPQLQDQVAHARIQQTEFFKNRLVEVEQLVENLPNAANIAEVMGRGPEFEEYKARLYSALSFLRTYNQPGILDAVTAGTMLTPRTEAAIASISTHLAVIDPPSPDWTEDGSGRMPEANAEALDYGFLSDVGKDK